MLVDLNNVILIVSLCIVFITFIACASNKLATVICVVLNIIAISYLMYRAGGFLFTLCS